MLLSPTSYMQQNTTHTYKHWPLHRNGKLFRARSAISAEAFLWAASYIQQTIVAMNLNTCKQSDRCTSHILERFLFLYLPMLTAWMLRCVMRTACATCVQQWWTTTSIVILTTVSPLWHGFRWNASTVYRLRTEIRRLHLCQSIWHASSVHTNETYNIPYENVMDI